MDHAIPDKLAEAFAANHLFCMADYHRPLRTEDATWFETESNPPFQIAFVTNEDIDQTSILGKATPAFVGCHDRPGHWVEMGEIVTHQKDLSTETRWKEHCEEHCEEHCKKHYEEHCKKHCKQADCEASHPMHIVLLLCFEGTNNVLIKSVKDMGGFVIVVEDANDPSIDRGDVHLRIPSAILPDIFTALTKLRSIYQPPPSTPIADVGIDYWTEYPNDKRLIDAWLDAQDYSEATQTFHLGRARNFCAFARCRRKSLADIIAMTDEGMSRLVKEYSQQSSDTEQRLLMVLRGVRDHWTRASTQE